METHSSIVPLLAASLLVSGVGKNERSNRKFRNRDTAQQDKRRSERKRQEKARRQNRRG